MNLSDEWWKIEAEYTAYLDAERKLFAWCLVNYGGYAAEAAEAKALVRYPYEPVEDEHRWMIFHEYPWYWAMKELHGDGFWARNRELEKRPPEYEQLSARLHGLD